MEEWKPIPGYEGTYDVSDCGNIRSFKYGKIRLLRLSKKTGGYLSVGLHTRSRQQKLVHRLVLEAFVGPCPEGMEGCHKNGNKADNSLGNLRWDTPKNNWQDNHRNGTANGRKSLTLVGEALGRAAKLCNEDVLRIREARLFGARPCDMHAVYGVSEKALFDVLSRKSWSHI